MFRPTGAAVCRRVLWLLCTASNSLPRLHRVGDLHIRGTPHFSSAECLMRECGISPTSGRYQRRGNTVGEKAVIFLKFISTNGAPKRAYIAGGSKPVQVIRPSNKRAPDWEQAARDYKVLNLVPFCLQPFFESVGFVVSKHLFASTALVLQTYRSFAHRRCIFTLQIAGHNVPEQKQDVLDMDSTNIPWRDKTEGFSESDNLPQ
ncbi:hypothetical protein DFH06DRAFT_1135259 [Mycena polygramma]|nr:hypothetical protein DFH06DRAFT_1135259 [Mycena polygramma]